MIALPAGLRALIDAGPLTHLTTINADGSPHVNVIWIGLDGDQIVSGHPGPGYGWCTVPRHLRGLDRRIIRRR